MARVAWGLAFALLFAVGAQIFVVSLYGTLMVELIGSIPSCAPSGAQLHL